MLPVLKTLVKLVCECADSRERWGVWSSRVVKSIDEDARPGRVGDGGHLGSIGLGPQPSSRIISILALDVGRSLRPTDGSVKTLETFWEGTFEPQ